MLTENLTEYVEQSIKTSWDFPALSNYRGETLTYRDVAENISRLHYVFRECHVLPGDKIAVIGKNSVNWAVTYLATITYGAVIVPGLPDFHTEDLHHIVNHSDSIFLFVADEIYEQLDETKMNHLKAIFSLKDFRLLHHRKAHVDQVVSKMESYFSDPMRQPLTRESFNLESIPNDRLACIFYTSGTTGFSKGVMLLHNSLIANIRYAHDHMVLQAGDTIVSFLPLAHAFGCAFEFLFPLTTGAHVVFLNKIPSPNIILEAFREVRPRLILSVPLVIEKIYGARIKPILSKKSTEWLMKIPFVENGINGKIRKQLIQAFGGRFHQIVIGAAALSTEVQTFLTKIKFPFTTGYGMTECGPLISYAPPEDYRMFAVGKIMDTLEIKIDSEDPATVAGEIMVRGENVMVGYYKNEEETKAAIDTDGWLHTGDLGLIDKDGFIYIKGRSKTMMLGPSGQNIYPEQIESKLNSFPFVSESLVIERNNKMVALVYPDMGLADSAGMDQRALEKTMEENRKALNQLLPSYITIHKIELYPEEFEKTPTKKIKRYLYTAA
jgi:long-chain acyl-CoA synthetase